MTIEAGLLTSQCNGVDVVELADSPSLQGLAPWSTLAGPETALLLIFRRR